MQAVTDETVAMCAIILMVVLLGLMIWDMRRGRQRAARRDAKWEQAQKRIADVTWDSWTRQILKQTFSPPVVWTEASCTSGECLCLSDEWALSAEECDGAFCLHRHYPPDGEYIGEICPNYQVEGPDGELLTGKLAFAWRVYCVGEAWLAKEAADAEAGEEV